ncbi:GFA family protein [soil metagenome]
MAVEADLCPARPEPYPFAMDETPQTYAGGCLCGAVRYEAVGTPTAMGHCYCTDCRKASGSGFIPFMGFPADAVRITGQTLQFRSLSFRGTEAVRNACPTCGGLVFGGEVGQDASHTLYAGSLDDPSLFHPTMAIFNRDRPDWAVLPPGLTVFETMPG